MDSISVSIIVQVTWCSFARVYIPNTWNLSWKSMILVIFILISSFVPVVVVYGLVAKFCLILAIPQTAAHQIPLSMGFSRQEYWNELPFPSPGDLPNLGIEPGSPTLQVDSLSTEPPGKSA